MQSHSDGEERLETPERVDLQVDLAGIGSRALACLIDALLVASALATLALFALLLSGGFRLVVAILALLLAFIIYWFYHAACEALWHGQTPGKRLLGLRVQRVGGYPIGWSEALIRNLLRVVDGQLAYGVGVLTMLVTQRHQRLGDLAAGTVVVRERTQEFVDLDRLGYGALDVGDLDPGAAPVLQSAEYELLRDFLSRRLDIEPGLRAGLEARLAATLRRRLAGRGALNPAWSQLRDEAFLWHIDAAFRGERIGASRSFGGGAA
jgi:uncharacterized RDD family membrane protein YckC